MKEQEQEKSKSGCSCGGWMGHPLVFPNREQGLHPVSDRYKAERIYGN